MPKDKYLCIFLKPNGCYCVYYPSNILFYKAAFWETFSQSFLNAKEILSALKILLVCSKCLVLFIFTIYSGYKLNVRT